VLLEQNRSQEALERWEWYQSRPLLQSKHDRGKSSAEPLLVKTSSVAPSPASSETRLVYANFKDGLQIWVSNGKGVQGKWVNVRQQDFERAVRDFIERCATPESSLDEIHERGRGLYAWLLQPVIAELPPSQLVVAELDRPAYNLPLEALMSPGGWYFGEKYPVSYSPGRSMEQSLRVPAPVGPRAQLLLLDASHAPEAGFLPGVDEQRSEITGMFPQTKIIDSASSGWAEARNRLARSEIIHYMGHGKPNGSGTSLDYNAKQSLRAKDLSSDLLKRSQLIVLAACSSGRGKDHGLWDSNSLVHAFLAAGVPRVIASHWNVDSLTTSRLMISFYRHVAANEPVTRAVFDARTDILRSEETPGSKPHPYSHPYYWAGFSLTGRVN
jgi:CHAT domain-containing protein